VRDIQGHLHDMYGVDVSPSLISEVTDKIQEEVKLWQDRRWRRCTQSFIWTPDGEDAARRQGREARHLHGHRRQRGRSEVGAGLWASTDEGAKHWMAVLTNLKNRGMKDAFIVCTDGLQGFPGAIEAIFPGTLVQTCIVHLIRASLAYVSWKERKRWAPS